MRWILGVLLLGFSAAGLAGPAVRVLALFPDKAMLEIDGEAKVLSAGGSGPGGVVLISADPNKAVIEIAGRREELRLGSAVSTAFAPVHRRELRIPKDPTLRGYYVDGLVNGQLVRFLVDTGATSVAISGAEARRLGILARLDGLPVTVETASGRATGHQVQLRELSVGGVAFSQVRAVVVEGDNPRNPLLGMNVLSEFDIDQRSNLMILRSRR